MCKRSRRSEAHERREKKEMSEKEKREKKEMGEWHGYLTLSCIRHIFRFLASPPSCDNGQGKDENEMGPYAQS
jgi:hypothetical protein